MSALPARLSELALRLLDESNPSFSRLACTSAAYRRHGKSSSPLYYAAVIGSCHLLEVIPGRGADVSSPSGKCGNALQGENVCAVRLLLERSADVNLPGGLWGNSLQAAVNSDSHEVARLLIDRGADINAFGGPYGNPVCTAINFGSVDMVRCTSPVSSRLRKSVPVTVYQPLAVQE